MHTSHMIHGPVFGADATPAAPPKKPKRAEHQDVAVTKTINTSLNAGSGKNRTLNPFKRHKNRTLNPFAGFGITPAAYSVAAGASKYMATLNPATQNLAPPDDAPAVVVTYATAHPWYTKWWGIAALATGAALASGTAYTFIAHRK